MKLLNSKGYEIKTNIEFREYRLHCVKSKILLISPYSVRIRENTDQNNFQYGHFLRSVTVLFIFVILQQLSFFTLIFRILFAASVLFSTYKL